MVKNYAQLGNDAIEKSVLLATEGYRKSSENYKHLALNNLAVRTFPLYGEPTKKETHRRKALEYFVQLILESADVRRATNIAIARSTVDESFFEELETALFARSFLLDDEDGEITVDVFEDDSISTEATWDLIYRK